VDATFGLGGYSNAILSNNPYNTLTAFDRDPAACPFAEAINNNRFRFVPEQFSKIGDFLEHDSVRGVVFDLGVSSPQLDIAERGFSFRLDGALDMRMSQSGMSAADVINTYPEEDIANILYEYGEERFSRRIARMIVAKRAEKQISTTTELANIVRSVLPRKGKDTIDPATRTFQALRIYVNQELQELEQGLAAATNLLAAGGRLVVVSFHSLEDRIVKNFMRDNSTIPSVSRHLPQQKALDMPLKTISRKAILPSAQEISSNPRARSAKLRVAEKFNPL
jgi:16S rRNA (cytosine1402-N4)-methyltransferase